MAEPAIAHVMTHADFLTFEESVEDRHAFHGGATYPTTGSTLMHGTVGTAFATTLNTLLRAAGCGCFAFAPDERPPPAHLTHAHV